MATIDAGARLFGKAYIHYKMAVAAVTMVVCAIVATFIASARSGWKTERRAVTDISCTPETKTDCEEHRAHSSCTTRKINACKVRVERSRAEISKRYSDGATPTVGDMVTVFFDPRSEDATMTLSSFPKGIALLVLGTILVANAVLLVFLFKVRNDATAQRVGAGVLAFDVASRLQTASGARPRLRRLIG